MDIETEIGAAQEVTAAARRAFWNSDVDSDEFPAIGDAFAAAKLAEYTLTGNAIWFAVVDVAAHEGHVTCERKDGDWTYQDVTSGRRIVYEGPWEREARRALDAFLVCDSVARGAYCYAHNPHPHV